MKMLIAVAICYIHWKKKKDDQTVGWKTCCKSPTNPLYCVRRYSEVSTGTGPTTASVECNEGYEMVGCSGYGIYRQLNSFFIGADGLCYATGSADKVYAVAIWYVYALCKEIHPLSSDC